MVTRELVLWSDTMDGSTAMILAGRLVQIKTVTKYLIRLNNSGFGTGNLVQSYAKRLAAASLFALVRMKGLEPSRRKARAPKACERVHIQCPC
jgi:hypothetical protein